jgi:hypothetical protein
MIKVYSLYKKAAIVVIVISAFFLCLQDCAADSAAIKSVTKVNVMSGYVILINYETHDKWTDGLIFKVNCKFNDSEFTFTSSVLNNIESGWHKTQIAISDVMKKRYGSLRSYEVELYRNGILVDKKEY